ncbi:MAG: hypothetical protein ACOC2C_03975 [Cyclonatronaceae bacterium]
MSTFFNISKPKIYNGLASVAKACLIAGLFLSSAGTMQAQQVIADNANTESAQEEAPRNSFAWLELEKEHLDQVIANFAYSLHSENQGVREAAIFHSFLLQLHFPDEQMSELENALYELTQIEREPRIRHKASIALYFFQDSSTELREELDSVPNGSRTEARLYQQALQVMNSRLFSDSSASGLSF